MRVSQAEHHRALAFQFGAVANTDDFQVAVPALGDAFDRVVDQRPRQAMHRGLRVVLPQGHQIAILLLHADTRRQLRIQLALGALHGHGVAFDFDRHSLGERDRLSSNSRHKFSS